MSYPAFARSEKNLHDFPKSALFRLPDGPCRRCGDQWEEQAEWSVWQWVDALCEGYGGCVALPAPAVSAPPDCLPVVSDGRNTDDE